MASNHGFRRLVRRIANGTTVVALSLAAFTAACSSPQRTRGTSDGGDGGASSELPVGTTEFTVRVEISDVIPTVGIVNWSAELESIDEATIEFGLDSDYGMAAPVDLDAPDNRTLLLGMKPSSTYHFRIVAVSDGTLYRSQDQTVDTGHVANGLPEVSVELREAAATMPGFVVSDFLNESIAFILDADGDYVWWYKAPLFEPTRARMSYDGKEMLIATNNVANNDTGGLFTVRMDGSGAKLLELPDLHHDFTVLPGNRIGYIEFDEDGVGTCDRIVELEDNGSRREVYSLRNDFAHHAIDQEWCHSNAISYDEDEGMYYLSVLDLNGIAKVQRASGTLQWMLGGKESTFGELPWRHQHGHQALDGGLLLFNNSGNVTTNHSLALEYAIDEGSSTAKLVWEYDGGLGCPFQGDVQRLPNGNTLVVYSAAGVWHEVDSKGTLLRKVAWPVGGATGYATWRDSLYGPPPK